LAAVTVVTAKRSEWVDSTVGGASLSTSCTVAYVTNLALSFAVSLLPIMDEFRCLYLLFVIQFDD